jgi:nicotinamide-nucleotide amidase
MNAAVIAVGTELLGSTRVDTNSLLIAAKLEKHGLVLRQKSVVPDARDMISAELRTLLSEVDVVLLSGGIGPTEDDQTKEGVAQALALELERDEAILQKIEARFAARGLAMPEVNVRQAMVFPGHRTIHNQRGSAPGFHLNVTFEDRPKHVWIFPGVPYELEAMLDNDLEPWLAQVGENRARFRRIVKVVGLAESSVEESLAPFYERFGGEALTILAGRGEIQLHIWVDGTADEAYPQLIAMEQLLREIFSDRVYGLDGDTLESVVGRLLASRGETVACAESCTGGLLASRMTDVSGSSAYFLGGVVVYTRESKLFLLGVDPAAIDDGGEVCEEVAREMARGARRRFGSTYGIGITGIAGPTGGTPAKPVGTVHIAVESREQSSHHRFLFPGDRANVKQFATLTALDMLRLLIVRGG